METISCWFGFFLSDGIHIPVKAFAPAEVLSCMDSTECSTANAMISPTTGRF